MTDHEVENILFLDIETVSQYVDFAELPVELSELWKKKSTRITGNFDSPADAYFQKAGIYAEFGKVVVIGLGYLRKQADGDYAIRVKALQNDNELLLLKEFVSILEKFDANNLKLCAHNGKEFDIPFLCRRLMIQGMQIPEILDVRDKKPWEITHLDTLQMWKFGDWKNYTSLELLTTILNIPSSKQDLDGSKVNEQYHIHQNLEHIAKYCCQDVVATAQVYLKLNALSTVLEQNIQFVE